MFETMPAPTNTVTKSGKYGPYQQQKREVTTSWVLNPLEQGVPQVVVTLTTFHYGDRKMFSSSLTWGTKSPVEPGSVFSVETWASDHAMIRVHTVAVARYSVKAMEAHHAEAMDAVEDHWAGTQRVFVEAAERNGLGEYAEVEA